MKFTRKYPKIIPLEVCDISMDTSKLPPVRSDPNLAAPGPVDCPLKWGEAGVARPPSPEESEGFGDVPCDVLYCKGVLVWGCWGLMRSNVSGLDCAPGKVCDVDRGLRSKASSVLMFFVKELLLF